MLLQKKTKPLYYLIGILLVILFYNICISNDILPSEYITIFDFRNYIDLVKNFSTYFHSQNFTPYYNSRILVPGLVHSFFELFQVNYSFENIQKSFLILNFLSILVALYYFLKIAKIKAYSQDITILGFSFLFINFFILKFSTYYPILMDVFGFTSGIILYYLYLVKHQFKFYIFLAISMFVFPTTILITLSLMASSLIRFNKNGLKIQKNLMVCTFLILIPIIAFFSFFCYHYYGSLNKTAAVLSIQLSTALIPVTLLLLFIFIYILLKKILPVFDGISVDIRGVLSLKLIVPLCILAIYYITSKFLSSNFEAQNTLSSQKFIYNLVYQAISFPMKFLITNFIYYGTFIIFILIYFRDFFSHAKKELDPFLKILMVIFILFSFGTETRQFLQIFPVIVFIFLDSVRSYNFNINFLFSIFALQLIVSRFWYVINSPTGFLGNDLTHLHLLKYPAQRYFQFQGPWLSTINSAIYSGIFVVVYFVIYFSTKHYIGKRK